MEFIDLSKGKIPTSEKEAIKFKSTTLEVILGNDPFNRVSGFLIPTKDENHQVCLVYDFRGIEKGRAKMKLYKRQREDVDSKWEDWEFIRYIE